MVRDVNPQLTWVPHWTGRTTGPAIHIAIEDFLVEGGLLEF